MSRKTHFHSVHFMFRDAQNAHPVLRSTARLGAECGVPSARWSCEQSLPQCPSTNSGYGGYDERLHLELGTRG